MHAAAMLPSCGHVFALLSLEVYEITINICWKKLPEAKTVEKKNKKKIKQKQQSVEMSHSGLSTFIRTALAFQHLLVKMAYRYFNPSLLMWNLSLVLTGSN